MRLDREHEQQPPKSTAKQFAEWASAHFEDNDERAARLFGIYNESPAADPEEEAPADTEENVQAESENYPMLRDGGEVYITLDLRPTREKFAEALNNTLAFDPFTDANGWRHL